MKLASLEDVFAEQLADLHSAETQLVSALPKVAKAASSADLRGAIETHLEETRAHVKRLEKIFKTIDMPMPKQHCQGMEGLLREEEEIMSAQGDPAARDAALIAAAQRVEHYEIAGYGTARALAEQLGMREAHERLSKTLREESHTDSKLTQIAMGSLAGTGVNELAAH